MVINKAIRHQFLIRLEDNFFQINIKKGQGKLIMKDGSYVEGEFKNGEILGKGYKYDKTRECEYTGK